MQQLNNATYAATKLALDKITDDQIATLRLAIGWGGYKVIGLPFYDKISPLFTEDGKMHSDIEGCFNSICYERVSAALEKTKPVQVT